MISAVIIEDEKHIQETLASIVEITFNDIIIKGYAESIADGYKLINKVNPDIVFLDVQLKDGLSFDLLKQFKHYNFKIIFTTSHEEYAIKAFKQSAIDYLLKPIESEDLIKAVYKARESILKDEIYKVNFLLENLASSKKDNSSEKILINSQDSLISVEVDSIVRCEASSNYTVIHLSNKEEIVVTKTLKDISEMIKSDFIIRSHRSHIVNLSYFQKIDKKDGDLIELSNQHRVPLGKTFRSDFLKQVELYSKK